jgi:hypothetical protein
LLGNGEALLSEGRGNLLEVGLLLGVLVRHKEGFW